MSGAEGGGTQARQVQELMATPSPFDALYGLEFVVCTDELVEGRLPIADHVKQPFGVVHGGVYSSIAEALASHGTNVGVAEGGSIALGLSNYTSHLRPATGGFLYGTARRRHRGRTTWVWDVDITDDEGRLCATARMTMAVRPAPTRLTDGSAGTAAPGDHRGAAHG
jgi:1,4-dihydroxy-2-naphthoyl-CoA hydrolase